jgi:iron complex outermembrane receptor protein
MKLKKTPIASAVALALMSFVTPVHAQQSDTTSADAPKSEAQGATAAQAAKDKAKADKAKADAAKLKAAGAKDADAKTKQEEAPANIILAQAPTPPATTTPPATPVPVQGLTVTGYRFSLERSLEAKRNADSVVEVVTADDIGKLPDKNIADAVQRVPGVTISSAAGGEGGFDENDRVSMRGTNPSLTQTLVNGHPIASGDWFVLDQVQTVGRSVSFSLLPSELVSQVIVRKSATADIVEGGVAGNVDIITRKPLEFRKQLTGEASIQAVYADLPKKTDGQFSGLINWKNEQGTMGVMLQGFSEKRHLRRDGQEILGYAPISPTSPLAAAHPDLANVSYPTLIGSAFFEQVRERNGGLVDVQVKPNNDLIIDFNAFYSHMKATNYNRNWMFWGSHVINGGAGEMPTSYQVTNGTLTSAVFPNLGTGLTSDTRHQYAIVDEIYRPGTYSETAFYNVDAKYRATDRLSFSGQFGYTRGIGKTPKQDVFEGDVFNTGATYTMHGISSATDVAFPNGNPSNFAGTSLDWIFGASPAQTEDKETYGQFDGLYLLGTGPWTSLKFGLRGAQHDRNTQQVAQGPNFAGPDPFSPANLPVWSGETYPGNFASGIGGNFPRQPWMLSPGELERWGDIYSNRDPVSRRYWPGEFELREKVVAVYAMANLEGQGWSGNFGVRAVQTKERVLVNIPILGCPVLAPCPQVPGAITTSAFGPFFQQPVEHTYTDILPSANLKLDLSKDLVARFAIARTMARPDFSALGGAISAEDTTHTGNGGNPDLKPIRSTNVDGTLEWYFAPQSLLSAGLFYMDLSNYVGFGNHQVSLLNIRTGTFDAFTISSPTNSSGKVKGLELAYQQQLPLGFGVQANYTYADAKETGDRDLVGASKNTYNIIGYYENYGFSARLAYTYRSHFFVGLDRSTPEYQDDTGTLAASLGYTINDNVTITFDALNLNDPTLKYYGANTDQPRAFYKNGRQYYAGVRIKF